MPMSQANLGGTSPSRKTPGYCEHVICCSQIGKCEIQRVQGSDGFVLFLCRGGLIEENLK